MLTKNLIVVAALAVSTVACSINESQQHDQDLIENFSTDVTAAIQDANIAPDQQMLATAMMSDAYIAFAEQFEAKGYAPRPEYAVDYGMSEEGQVYVLPFETGDDTFVAATAFKFHGDTLIEVSAAEYHHGNIDSGIAYSYGDQGLQSESLDPTFRSFSTWWSCFWRNAGGGCVQTASCYATGPGWLGCVAAVCGASGAWWALACL